MSVSESILVGIGNPLLDILVPADDSLLKKYDLKANDAILAQQKHLPLYEEVVQNYSVEYVPGGATQNSIKVAQWLLKKPFVTVFSGCIAHDKFGAILDKNCTKVGVKTVYQYHDGSPEPTGVCAVLITHHHRSLVTNLGSAACFTIDHLDCGGDLWPHILKAKFYYVAGYFLTSCVPAILKVGKHAADNDKTLVFNLAAPFLCQYFKQPMMEVMPYVDILFGNNDEAEIFAKENGIIASSLKDIALEMAALPKFTAKPRLVIITQGSGNVIAVQSGDIREYPVCKLADDAIVDTNGAGDAFVGGFLSQLVQDKSLEECIRCAISTATVIIQQSGCTFPETPTHTW